VEVASAVVYAEDHMLAHIKEHVVAGRVRVTLGDLSECFNDACGVLWEPAPEE
jgi:hypothetical protein